MSDAIEIIRLGFIHPVCRAALWFNFGNAIAHAAEDQVRPLILVGGLIASHAAAIRARGQT